MATMMQSSAKTSCRASQREARPAMAIRSQGASLRMFKPFVSGSVAPCARSVAGATVPSRTIITRAAASPAQAPAGQSSETKQWYALVASAEFFFNDPQNESLAEQLRERVRFFKEQGKDADFYFVPEPKWLDAKYPEQAKKVKRPCVALVSTDKNWIVFMKLRLDRVLRFDMGPVPDAEVLAVGGSVPDFKPMENWTAPYSQYAPKWWEVFYPKA